MNLFLCYTFKRTYIIFIEFVEMDNHYPNFIQLKSKLLAPNLSGTIERGRLYSLFNEIRNKRIITITAGAGYGKTTFVAQACRYLDINTVWYRLDTSDSDFLTFIYYLISGIKQYVPDFGNNTIPRIKSTQALKREQKSILTVFLSEIEEVVKEKLIIVLDDYHLIHESPEIRNILTFLTEYLPETIHLIIISRNVPDLNLSRFIARRESFDVGEVELSFNIQEIDSLYKEVFHHSFNEKDLEILHAQTEGWVSGLVLFNYAIEDKSETEIGEELSRSYFNRQVFFDYLEENIYSSLDEKIIDFLLKTSILSQLDVQFCNQLLGIVNSKEILSILEKKHLFTFPFDERRASYYYHHLFQDFLQSKLDQTLGNESRIRFFGHVADMCIKFNKPEEAIHHYLSAKLYDKASDLLNTIGRQLIKDARFSLFNSFYENIPYQYLEKNPWIQYSHARSLELSGNIYEAIEAYQKAKAMFSNCNVTKGIGLSLNRLFSNYYIVGDFLEAEEKLKELLMGIQGIPRLYVDILGHLIFITSHLGKIKDADFYYEKAIEALDGIDETDLQAWIYVNYGFRFHSSGDFLEGKRFGIKSNRISTRLGMHPISIYSYHLISIISYYLGDFENGFKAAISGLKIAQERGQKEASHAWLLIDACFCATANGDTSAAINYGLEGLKICQELESSWSEAWAYHALQDAYLKDKNLIKAEKNAQLAVNSIQHLILPLDEGLMKGSLASVLIEKGDLDNVEVLLNEAENKLKNSKLNLSRTYLWYARYYWLKKQMAPCMDKLRAALTLCEKHQYDPWVIYEKRWIIPLLIEIYTEKKLQKYINRLFMNFGLETIGTLKQLEKSKDETVVNSVTSILTELNKNLPTNLKVFCFGNFKLFRGDEEIHSESWSSEKSKMLFKYLCYHHSHGYILKDRLLELLWPDEDPSITNNRFHVALTALRRTLEPELPKGMPSSYLLREGDAYRVQIRDKGYLDIKEFSDELEHAKKETNDLARLTHYLKAEALYKGDLFEEDQYLQWCIEARDDYRDQYLNILNYIIDHYNKAKDHLQCIEYAKKYLKVDEYAEKIYRVLMKQYNHEGNRSMVIKTYEQCKHKIEDDLDCPLSDETNKLYEKLRS